MRDWPWRLGCCYLATVYSTLQPCTLSCNRALYLATMYSTLQPCTLPCNHVLCLATMYSTLQPCTLPCNRVRYLATVYSILQEQGRRQALVDLIRGNNARDSCRTCLPTAASQAERLDRCCGSLFLVLWAAMSQHARFSWRSLHGATGQPRGPLIYGGMCSRGGVPARLSDGPLRCGARCVGLQNDDL